MFSPRDQVRNDLFLQLVSAGTAQTQDQAFTVAEVVADQFEAQASLFKTKTALDLFREQNFRIENPAQANTRADAALQQTTVSDPVITDPMDSPGEWQAVELEALAVGSDGRSVTVKVNAGEQFAAILDRRDVANDLLNCLRSST